MQGWNPVSFASAKSGKRCSCLIECKSAGKADSLRGDEYSFMGSWIRTWVQRTKHVALVVVLHEL